MVLLDGIVIIAIIQSFFAGFRQGLVQVSLRFFRYLVSLLAIMLLVSSLTQLIIDHHQLQQNLSYSLQGNAASVSSTTSFTVQELLEGEVEYQEQAVSNLRSFSEELRLTSSWAERLVSFLKQGDERALLVKVFRNYEAQEEITDLSLSVALFSYLSVYVTVFSLVALIVLALINLIIKLVFSSMLPKINYRHLLTALPAGLINGLLTAFILIFMLQLFYPLFEFFTLDLEMSYLYQSLEKWIELAESYYRQYYLHF